MILYEDVRHCVHEAIEEIIRVQSNAAITPTLVEKIRARAMENVQAIVGPFELSLVAYAAIDACLALQMHQGAPAPWRSEFKKEKTS